MLNSLSLRLNNLIARAETNEQTGITTNVPVTVDLEILTAIHNRPNPPYKGIVLTEEWLVKLGFGDFSNNITLKCGHRLFIVYEKFSKKLGLEVFMLRHDDIRIGLENVTFVHQLQNFFYSLTGKELTVIE